MDTNSITRLNVKLCESKGLGSRDPMYVELKNDDGEECVSEGLPIGDGQQGHFLQFSSDSLGSCQNFTLTRRTTAWLSNEGNDDLCITHVYLDTVSQEGNTKQVRCRYDANTHLQLQYFHGKKALPLLCYWGTPSFYPWTKISYLYFEIWLCRKKNMYSIQYI